MTQGTSFRTPTLTDAELRASPVPVSGPLTDAELRATAVPISGTVSTGGLTDTQIRATPVAVTYGDTPILDAFNRLRIATPQTIFSSSQEYTTDALRMENYVAGTATATYTQATASTTLSTLNATSGNRAMRQSYVYWRYQPGKSQAVKLTGVLAKSGTPTGAAVARIGYFDDSNGMFFGRDVTGYFVAIRSDTTGSVVDNKVYQSSWNKDKMDGTGSSGITADFTKEHIFFIDFQWLGVGRVRLGLVINGLLYYVHEFDHANTTTVVYMRTPNLPVRYEVFNSGGAGSLITMEAICVAIESEGGVPDEGGFTFEFDNVAAPATAANSATLTPIFSFRCKDTFGGLTYRGLAREIELDFIIDQDTYFEWVWNATLVGGAWVDVNTAQSGMQFNRTLTSATGGIPIHSGLIPASGSGASSVGGIRSQTPTRLILARTYANVRDTLTLVARGIGGASTVYATCNFEEQR